MKSGENANGRLTLAGVIVAMLFLFYYRITVLADLGHGKSESKMASMDLWGDQHEGGGGSPGDDTLPPSLQAHGLGLRLASNVRLAPRSGHSRGRH